MNLSTGSRITIDGINGTAIVTDWKGNALMAKYDREDHIFELTDQVIIPIRTK